MRKRIFGGKTNEVREGLRIHLLLVVVLMSTLNSNCSAPQAPVAPVNAAPVESMPKRKWHLSESKSPMDDSKTVVVVLEADNSITGWPGKTFTPDLIIRCKEKKTDAYVNTGMNANVEYGKTNEATVRFRIDEQKSVSQVWGESTSNDSLFSPAAVSFARNLAGHESMMFEFTPFNSAPAQIAFDLKGLEAPIQAVADTCKWPAPQSQKELEVQEVSRKARQIFSDTGFAINDSPFESHGVKIPMPLGADVRGPKDGESVSFFAVTNTQTRTFFSRAMPLYGWKPAQGLDCYASGDVKACLDLDTDNRIVINFSKP